jgi:hypothetical protein
MKKKKNVLTEWGIQSRIARRCGICRPIIGDIFNGKRRATLKQAAQLEEYFISRGIPINRWDLLYGVDTENGQTLMDYLDNKANE